MVIALGLEVVAGAAVASAMRGTALADKLNSGAAHLSGLFSYYTGPVSSTHLTLPTKAWV